MKWVCQAGASVEAWLAKRITRDLVLVGLGSYGFIAQVHHPDPSEVMVLASLALLGLPVALRADERNQQ